MCVAIIMKRCLVVEAALRGAEYHESTLYFEDMDASLDLPEPSLSAHRGILTQAWKGKGIIHAP